MGTSDSSCTLPAVPVLTATPFPTDRLSSADAANGAGTREGYIEIIDMADLPPGTATTSPVYATTKHADGGGAPACSAAILANIEQAYPTLVAGPPQLATNATATALKSPTTGLMANWTIINVPYTTVFTGAAVAIGATTDTRIVYAQQSATAVSAMVSATAYPNIASTFDGMLLTEGFATEKRDFPDLSTPYEIATASAGTQTYALSSRIAHTSIINEFLLDPGIAAKTDWLFSMPTRRYLVSGRGNPGYGVTTAATGAYATTVPFTTGQANTLAATDVCTNETATAYGSCTYAGDGATAKSGPQGFFRWGYMGYAADGRSSCIRLYSMPLANREEVVEPLGGLVVITQPVSSAPLCGAVSMLSLNGLTGNTAAIGANLVAGGVTIPFAYGWAEINLNPTGRSGGLPVIGQAFVRVVNPAVSAGVSGSFGGSWAHRWNGKQ